MSKTAFAVEYFEMRVGRLPDRFVVAKVARVSSPPVASGTVPDPRASALGRLADVLRGGRATRAYSDFADYKQFRSEDPASEWLGYVAAVCQALRVDRIDRLDLLPLPTPGAGPAAGAMSLHRAWMNDLPCLVARTGPVFGAPVALLLRDDPDQSAIDRLADVLRDGARSRSFSDFALAQPENEALADWVRYGRTVAGELAALPADRQGGSAQSTGRANRPCMRAFDPQGDESWQDDPTLTVGRLYYYSNPAPQDRVFPDQRLIVGDVVRMAPVETADPFAVRIVDRETGAELGVVDASALQPL